MARFSSIRFMVEADLCGWLPPVGIVLTEDEIHRILQEAEHVLAAHVTAAGTVSFELAAHIVSGTNHRLSSAAVGPCNITIDLTPVRGSMGQKNCAAHATLRVRQLVSSLGVDPTQRASAGRGSCGQIDESRRIPNLSGQLGPHEPSGDRPKSLQRRDTPARPAA